MADATVSMADATVSMADATVSVAGAANGMVNSGYEEDDFCSVSELSAGSELGETPVLSDLYCSNNFDVSGGQQSPRVDSLHLNEKNLEEVVGYTEKGVFCITLLWEVVTLVLPLIDHSCYDFYKLLFILDVFIVCWLH